MTRKEDLEHRREHWEARNRLQKRTKTIEVAVTPELYALLKWITGDHYRACRYGVTETLSYTMYKLAIEGILARIARIDKLDEFAVARLEAKLKGRSYEKI